MGAGGPGLTVGHPPNLHGGPRPGERQVESAIMTFLVFLGIIFA